MRVIKVDFTTELIDIPDGSIERRFVKTHPNAYAIVAEDTMPDMRSAIYEDFIYKVETVRKPTGETEKYLIKSGEKELVEKLFLISDKRIENLVMERVDELFMAGRARIIRETENRIRTLPWWKRLLNNF